MSFEQWLLAGESQTLEFKSCFDKSAIESLVAEAFYLTNNIEKYGSGFIRIRKELQDYPEATFEIQEIGGGVLLTFARAEAMQQEESGATAQQSSEKILGLLEKSPTMTTKELAQHLDISQRAIEKQIDKLKRDGRLHRIGPDRSGYWQVLKTPS